METVKARLSIEINVDCPNPDCKELIDLLYSEDTYNKDHNEECFLLDQALNFTFNSHLNFICEDVKCSACKEVFNVKELEW